MKYLLAILVICCPVNAWATITAIQSFGDFGGSNLGNTVGISGITSGSAIIVTVSFCDGGACSNAVAGLTATVTATGCSFSLAQNGDYPTVAFRTFIALNCSAGSTLITSTLSGSFVSGPNFHNTTGVEFSNVLTASALDQVGDEDSDETPTASVDTDGATAQANEVVYGAILSFDATITTGAGFTVLTSLTTGGGGFPQHDEYKTVTSTGVQTATWGITGADTYSLRNIITLKDVVAGGSTSSNAVIARRRR
jgi:hypothetical protein